MSISSQVARSGPFLITSLPQVIPVGFPFQSEDDLIVYNGGAVGDEIDPPDVLGLGSDYTVTGGGYNVANEMQTGSITVSSGGAHNVAVGDYLVIARNVPINQTTSFQATGPLTIQQVEQALDKQATLSQQVNEKADRALHFEPNEFLSTTLLKSSRAGKVLAFDAAGNINYLEPDVTPGDASNSLVTATGTTTPRSLANRFGDMVTVKDFGAAGDGVTDDTAAFQAAADHGGMILVPTGKYLITSTITVVTAARFIGEGSFTGPGFSSGLHPQVFLIHNFSGTFFDFKGDADSDTLGAGSGLCDVTLLQANGNGSGASGVGIKAYSTDNVERPNWFRVERVNVEMVSGANDWSYCLDIDGTAASNLIRDIWVRECRFVATTNSTGAVRVLGAANFFMSDCEGNGSNSHMVISGSSGRESASIYITSCAFTNLTLDWAINARVMGGSYSRFITTANSLNVTSWGASVSAATPTILGTRTTFVGLDSGGKTIIATNNNISFTMGANEVEFSGPPQLANNVALNGRNAAGLANVAIAKVDASDAVDLMPAALGKIAGQQMSYGANDSGGAGFRLLRVPN